MCPNHRATLTRSALYQLRDNTSFLKREQAIQLEARQLDIASQSLHKVAQVKLIEVKMDQGALSTWQYIALRQ